MCTNAKVVVSTGFILSLSCTVVAQQERLSRKQLMMEKMGQPHEVIPMQNGRIGGPPQSCTTSTMSCCESYSPGNPGCNDPDCCAAVCVADPFCCNTLWDPLCANAANSNPGGVCDCARTPPPTNNLCADRIDVDYGNTPFSTLGATTDGPAHTLCGDGRPDLQVNQDIWFNFTPTATDAHLISLCTGTSYDSKMAIYDGCACPIVDDSRLLACDDDGCGPVGGPSRFVVNLVAGNCYKIRVGGFGGAMGSGMLSILRVNEPNPACFQSDHHCLTQGGPGCHPFDCCAIVCLVDPFCCEVAWDGMCLQEAAAECGCGFFLCPIGDPPNCPTDLAPAGGDGQTNVDDLLILLQNWGPCD